VTTTDPGWKASRSKRAQASIIGALGYPALWALGKTWRWVVEGDRHYEDVMASGRVPVMAFWHGRILPAVVFYRHRGIVVITSDNFDGEWTARIIHRFGYATARGSTSRNAARATLKTMRSMAEGRPVGLTVDGPRGPALVAQPGAVWLAKASGNPILPFHMEAASSWTASSWDATQIPRPFSRIAMVMAEPFYVPGDADDTALEAARLELEARLHALKPRALSLLGRNQEGGNRRAQL
jgi:lysophospholipid acyltransferase (LPLAT)-like uncharacterized protein